MSSKFSYKFESNLTILLFVPIRLVFTPIQKMSYKNEEDLIGLKKELMELDLLRFLYIHVSDH